MQDTNINASVDTLCQTLLDSLNGYQECANQISDPILKNKFTLLADKRKTMLENLKHETMTTAENTPTSGSVAAAAHRVFIDLKSLLSSGNKDTIIKEIERGESYLIEKYQDALQCNVPMNLRSVLEQQVTETKQDLASVKSFYQG